MDRAKVKSLLSTIDECVAAIEAELEADQLISELKKKTKATPKLKGAINEFTTHAEFLKLVSQDLQRTWLEVYKDVVWINFEIQKCKSWMMAKGVRAKNTGLRITNWLSSANKTKPTPINQKQKDAFNKIVAD